MKPQGAHAHEDRLLDFVYGELPPAEARLVEQHVEGCSRCSETLDGIRGVRTTMSRLPLESAPDTGLESLLAYAQQSARRSAAGPAPAARWWRRLLAPALGVAAMSVLGVVVVQVNRDVDLSPALKKEAAQEQAPRPKVVSADELATPPAPAPTGAPVTAEAETYQNALDDKSKSRDMLKRAEAKPTKLAPPKSVRLPSRADWSNAGSGGGFPPKKDVAAGDAESITYEGRGAKGSLKLESDMAVGKSLPSVSTARRAEPAPPEALAEAAGPAPRELRAEESQAAQYGAPAPRQEISGSASRSAPMASKDSADDLVQQAPGHAQAPSAAPPPPPPVTQSQPPAAATSSFAQTERVEAKKAANVAQKPREKSAGTPVPLSALLRQADEARRSGNRDEEAAMLRAALAAGVQGSQLVDVLSRLCDADFALGNRRSAIENCNRVMRIAPGSSEANVAQRRLKREQALMDEADSESKAGSPVTQ
ncbi:anti-sigma factor [Vitiosangium sp. GDMCC 1.1324]|uniref:anti-sigma factor family protein n=1 Tax=Vitiosangium sp. (strain GDMCC 1.1324) TaxID=2138576 RepID=UPI000D362E04|nr:zf-HC2 domain-containing protein [Vitiosangium sp. GDMCC 1.1324]PTL76130.1 hypothetical protein DAT35_51080 [Vitiosangium sp. GDMCC 1.1324]